MAESKLKWPWSKARKNPTVLGDVGFITNGSDISAVNFEETSPIDEADINRLRGSQKTPLYQVTLEDENGKVLIDNGQSTTVEMSRAEWLAAYYEMQYDDAVADALNILFARLHTFPYYVRPASMDAADINVAAFITDQLGIGYTSFSKYPSFRRLMNQFELSLVYGEAASEIVLMEGDKGTALVDKLVPIHPFSIKDIERDNKGGPKNLVVEGTTLAGESQQTKNKKVKLPFAKVVHFAYRDNGTQRGESLLKAAYIPWRIKRAMLKLVNAGYERFLLGIPVLSVPRSVMQGTKEWELAEATLKALAARPRSGAILPEGWTIEIQVVNSQMPDAQPYIIRQDLAIKRALGVGFTSIGTDALGSNYKASETLSGVSDAFSYDLALLFCELVNLYFINRLVYINFPELNRFPQLSMLRSANAEPSAVLNAFSQMVSAASSGTGEKGFDESRYEAIALKAPRMIREMLGIEEDQILTAVEAARRSIRK